MPLLYNTINTRAHRIIGTYLPIQTTSPHKAHGPSTTRYHCSQLTDLYSYSNPVLSCPAGRIPTVTHNSQIRDTKQRCWSSFPRYHCSVLLQQHHTHISYRSFVCLCFSHTRTGIFKGFPYIQYIQYIQPSLHRTPDSPAAPCVITSPACIPTHLSASNQLPGSHLQQFWCQCQLLVHSSSRYNAKSSPVAG